MLRERRSTKFRKVRERVLVDERKKTHWKKICRIH